MIMQLMGKLRPGDGNCFARGHAGFPWPTWGWSLHLLTASLSLLHRSMLACLLILSAAWWIFSLLTFHGSGSWMVIDFFFWVFKENLQWLNQMWFFHPCLGHLHNESHAWDPWRSGTGGTGKGIASVWCLSSLSPACCLFTYWVQPGMLVAIWNNLWLDDVLEEALLHWVLLWDQMGIVLPSGLAREA